MMAMAAVAVEEEDLWWYVCTVCHQAFNDPLGLRVHKRQAHPSVRSACALILSQAVDLNPIVKVIRCTADAEGLAIRFTSGDDEPNEHEQDHHDAESDLSIGDDHDEEIDIKEEFPGNLYTQVSEAGDRSCVITESTDTDDKEADPEIEIDGDPGLCKLKLEPKTGSEDQIQPDSMNNDHDQNVDHDDDASRYSRRLRNRTLPKISAEQNSSSEEDEGNSDANCEDVPDVLVGDSDDNEQSDSDWEGETSLPGRKRRKPINTSTARSTSSRIEYSAHCKFNDQESAAYRCGICWKGFGRPEVTENHMASDHANHLSRLARNESCDCKTCYKDAFLRPSVIIEGGWECKLCQNALAEWEIRSHINEHHPTHKLSDKTKTTKENSGPSEWQIAQRDQKLSMSGTKEDKVKRKPRCYSCVTCGKSYSGRTTYYTHVNTAHRSGPKPKCSICHKEFRSNEGVKHHKNTVHATSRDYVCTTCGGAFKSAQELRTHMLYHDESNRTHVCDICNKAFFTSSGLHTHKQSHNTRDIMCPACGQMFKCDRDLRFHHKRQHTDIRPFKCDKCDASFKVLTGLMRHAAVHMESMPFPCSQCPKAFKLKHDLKTHTEKVHEKKRKAVINICRICKEEFPGRISLLRHEMEVHDFVRSGKKLQCKFCDKKFSQGWCLRQHEVSHTNERSFKCDHPGCNKAFQLTSHLRTHRFSHLTYGELPHVCDICQKRFGQASQLRNHKRRIHDKEKAKLAKSADTEPAPQIEVDEDEANEASG